MFLLLAAAIFTLNSSSKQTRSCKWFIAALILVALVRLNQAVYFWFQIESARQAVILGSAVLRPLMLGSWLLAWREWFDLQRPQWLPKIIAILALSYLATQVLGIFWVSNAFLHTNYPAMADYIRLLLLALMLFILYRGIRQQGVKDWLVFVAALVVTIGLFPQEVSQLHIIPGIWFPFGVGVSRSQFFYAAFVLVMYLVLIQKSRKLPPA